VLTNCRHDIIVCFVFIFLSIRNTCTRDNLISLSNCPLRCCTKKQRMTEKSINGARRFEASLCDVAGHWSVECNEIAPKSMTLI
jgi:hypothetical protein